jgi:SAM-dependent methyltransferase
MLPIHYAKHSVFNYDDIPAGYYFEVMERGPAIQRYWHRRKFSEIASRIPDRSIVLDLGCGPGSFLSIFAESHPNSLALGADISSRQIEFARERVGKRFGDRVRFLELSPDTVRMPIADRSVDYVTCIEVLEHIHPFFAIQLLSEARRVLKPSGHLLVTTPNYRSLWPLIEWVLERKSEVKYHDQHINKFTPNSFVKFVETAGFDVHRSSSVMIASWLAAGLSARLAKAVDRFEQRFLPKLGNLLVVEASPLPVESQDTRKPQGVEPTLPTFH